MLDLGLRATTDEDFYMIIATIEITRIRDTIAVMAAVTVVVVVFFVRNQQQMSENTHMYDLQNSCPSRSLIFFIF